MREIWRGINFASVDDYKPIVKTLTRGPRATSAIVIDPGRDPAEYVAPVRAIAAVSDVVIRIRDSYAEKEDPLTPDAYEQLAADLYATLNPWVKGWEVGNEWNGDWLPPDIVEKIQRAAALLKRFGARRIVTTFLEEDVDAVFRAIEANPFDVEVYGWSWYPRQNPGLEPDWKKITSRLWARFPNVKQAILEFGWDAPPEADDMTPLEKADLIRAIDGLDVGDDRWLRGGFCWYGREELIPWTRKLSRVWAQSWSGT